MNQEDVYMTTRLEIFARKLNELRGEIKDRYGRPLNDKDLAEWIRDITDYPISSASINYWSRGERLPRGDNLHALAYALGREIYEAAGYPDFKPSHWTLKILDEEWENMPKEDRDRIEKMAENAKNGGWVSEVVTV
jgi:hypothetical protein